MTRTLTSALAYSVFGLLTLIGFLTINMLPESVSASDVVQSVTEFLEPGTAIDPDNLVKLGDETFAINTDPSVSMEPLSTTRVRKIAYGKSEWVTITTTSTGTYSSDAMLSPNVKYPGIEVSEVEDEHGHDFWGGDSFLYVIPTEDGYLFLGEDDTCVVLAHSVIC